MLRGMVLWPQPPVWRLQPPSAVLSLSGRREGVANRSGTENITPPIQFVFSESRSSHSVCFLNQNFNWKFYEVSFQSCYCFYFLIITSVLPAAFGKHGISAKVLESISKQVVIKALKTETCESCAITGSVPKVICFYEKHECVQLHPLPSGAQTCPGGRKLPLV